MSTSVQYKVSYLLIFQPVTSMSFPVPTVTKQKVVLLQVDLCYCGNRLVLSFVFLKVDS